MNNLPITNKKKWRKTDCIYREEIHHYEELSTYEKSEYLPFGSEIMFKKTIKETIHEYVINHQNEGIMILYNGNPFNLEYHKPLLLDYP